QLLPLFFGHLCVVGGPVFRVAARADRREYPDNPEAFQMHQAALLGNIDLPDGAVVGVIRVDVVVVFQAGKGIVCRGFIELRLSLRVREGRLCAGKYLLRCNQKLNIIEIVNLWGIHSIGVLLKYGFSMYTERSSLGSQLSIWVSPKSIE